MIHSTLSAQEEGARVVRAEQNFLFQNAFNCAVRLFLHVSAHVPGGIAHDLFDFGASRQILKVILKPSTRMSKFRQAFNMFSAAFACLYMMVAGHVKENKGKIGVTCKCHANCSCWKGRRAICHFIILKKTELLSASFSCSQDGSQRIGALLSDLFVIGQS